MATQYVLQLVILSASVFGLNGVPVPVLPAAIIQKLLYQLFRDSEAMQENVQN